MAEVYLVRHGETEWSVSGRHTSSSDIPLTPDGQEAARAAGRRLASLRPVLVLTSPLQRARETCRLAGLGGPAEVTPDLVEWEYGEYEGRTTKDIRADRPGWWLWRDGAPGGERPADVGRRVDRVIALLRAVDGPAAVFAHGHVLRVLGARWVDLAPSDGGRLALSTGSVSVLGWERDAPVIEGWNDRSHLLAEPT